MNINDIPNTELYNNAFYLAVEYAGDFEYVSQMKASLYDYLFAFDNNFDTEAEYNIWLLGTIKGFEYAINTTESYMAAEDEWISVA